MKRLNLGYTVGRGFFSSLSIVVFTLAGLISSQALAENWKFKATVFADRNAENHGEDGRLELRNRLGGLLEASHSNRLENGHRTNLDFFLASSVYPEYSSINRYDFGVAGEYIAPLTYGLFKQLRFFGEFTHAHSERGTVFDRPRLGVAVRLEPLPRHTLQFRTRLGYRDHNDRLVRNYDHYEWLVDVMHLWVSEDRSLRTTTFLYAEGIKAKANRFDYSEFGFRFIARKAVSENREFIGRISGHIRNYLHTDRNDKRIRATIGHLWRFEHNVELEAYTGFERNISSHADKDFGGFLLGLSLSKEF